MTFPDSKTLRDAVEEKRQWATDVLSGWVRCPSTLGNERSAQLFIEQIYRDMGLHVSREPVEQGAIESLAGYSPAVIDYDGRPNIVGKHQPPSPAGRSLIVNGHVDVVSAAPEPLWSGDPFDPKVFTDDLGETWMQGRGAGDMKGGSVAALWAFEALRHLGLEPSAPVVFQSCIEEECTGNGTLAMLAKGEGADACLIPEPFDQTVLEEQAGVLWFEIHMLGKTTHVLGAQQGVNAIDKAWHIYQYLRSELEAPANRLENLPLSYRSIDHPANLNLGVIQGGDWPSTVAGDCLMRFRMGILPGTSSSQMTDRVLKVVARACESDDWLTLNPPRIVFKGFKAEPCLFDVGSDFGQTLIKSHEIICGEAPKRLHATCTTDARFFNLYYGIPATCYGPRAVNIHGADERVSLDSMARVAQVYARFIMAWCGLSERR